jgi:hypothetical protein
MKIKRNLKTTTIKREKLMKKDGVEFDCGGGEFQDRFAEGIFTDSKLLSSPEL